jgi:hypothetical protein
MAEIHPSAEFTVYDEEGNIFFAVLYRTRVWWDGFLS